MADKITQEGLPLGVTDTTLKQWKAKHGEVHLVSVPLDDEGAEVAHGYFRKPDLDVMSAAGKFEESDPVKAMLIVYESCKLKVDEHMDLMDECRMSAAAKVVKLFKVRAASIKKL